MEAGNYVIYPTEESGLAPLEAGKQILILRETPNTQLEDSSQIYFKSNDVERALDKLTMQVQELARDSYRAVKVSHFDTTSPEDFTEALFEAGAKAEEAAARAATSESNAALSEQNAASSASSAASASASAAAAAELAGSHADNSLRNAERAEQAAADSDMHATHAAESASMAADLLQEVSDSIYNKAQVDAKISGLQAEIDIVESYIPSGTSDSNMLVNKKELLDEEMDIREDLNQGLSELQTQITAQAAAIAGKQEKGDYATVSQVNAKQDKLVAGPNITIEGNVISATGGGGGGTGVDVSPATEQQAGIVALATQNEALEGFDDSKAMTPLKTAQKVYESVGRVIQLGFDGTLSGNVLTFEPDTDSPYEIKNGFSYEIDLLFPAVVADGALDENIEMVINNNGESIKILNALNDNTSTNITVGNMKQIMKYTTDIGFRWIFNARFATTQDGTKAFVMPSTVVNVQGGGSDVVLPDNLYTEDNLIAGENITFSEVLPEGGIDEHTLSCFHLDGTAVDEVTGYTLNPTMDNSVHKFGTGSSMWTNSTRFPWGLNNYNDFSFDYWVYVPNASRNETRLGLQGVVNSAYTDLGMVYFDASGAISFKVFENTFATEATVKLGIWTHIYVYYKAEDRTFHLFVDGKEVSSTQIGEEQVFSGAKSFINNGFTVSRFDEIRISDCIRWTEDFTPPTEPYTLATGPSKKAINAVIPEVELPDTVYTQDNLVAGDNIEIKEVVNPNIIDENCILCMHFDNDNKDSSLYSDLSDSTGLTTQYNSTSKFGTASAYVNAGAVYSPKFVEINNEVTIDFWAHTSLNPNGSGAQVNIGNFSFAAYGSFSQPQFYLQLNSNSIKWPHNYDVSLIKEGWNHFAGVFLKDENGQIVYRFFVNGKKVLQDASGQYAYFSNDYDLSFMNFVAGYGIDEFRVTKKAVWLDDFIPPTEPYTKGEGVAKKAISAVIPPVKLPSDLYRRTNLLGGNNIEIVPEPVEGGIDDVTVACWHFDGKLEDEISGFVPNAFSTDFLISGSSKFGSGCCNIKYTSTLATFNEFDSFAVDFWYKHNSEYQSAYVGINSDNYGSTTAPTNGYLLRITSTQIGFQHSKYHENNSDSEYVDFPMYSSGIWHHIVVQRIGASILQLFVDGTMLLQKTMDLSLDRSNNVVFYGPGQYFDEIRVSHTSRYNGDFTPPTRQYSIAEPTGNYVINYKASSNVSIADFIVESFSDEEGNWYRVWNSGWLEQGGKYDNGTAARTLVLDVTFLKPFSNANYFYNFHAIREDSGNRVGSFGSASQQPTSISSIFFGASETDAARYLVWYACGQGAQL